jgi:hypothetical protein
VEVAELAEHSMDLLGVHCLFGVVNFSATSASSAFDLVY